MGADRRLMPPRRAVEFAPQLQLDDVHPERPDPHRRVVQRRVAQRRLLAARWSEMCIALAA